jgi:hypothetical protein
MQEELEQQSLEYMQPDIHFKRDFVRKVKLSEEVELGNGEKDLQIKIQTERESKILSKIYYQEENIPKYPAMDQMKKCDAKQQQITQGDSLGKYSRDLQRKKSEELSKKMIQRKKISIKF